MSKNIADRLANVQSRVSAAIQRSSWPNRRVLLIGASKFQPLESLHAAVRAGLQDLGENYVQELTEKRGYWGAEVAQPHWHLIGPLQTNKAKFVVGQVKLIHSLDRLELAQVISKKAQELKIVQDVLVQVHLGDEAKKHGVLPDKVEGFVLSLREFGGIRVKGLMSLPPLSEVEAVAKRYFQELVEIRNHLRLRAVHENLDLEHLSMGTSADFEWAIEEGATIVRVGSSIFGERV